MVEDDDDTRNALAVLLNRAGAHVTAVESASAAMAAVERSRPDLVVSDIGLPIEDGYSFVHRLREWEAATSNNTVPAIALTAFARATDRQRALEAGFQEHIVKPADADQLLSAAKQLLVK